MTYLFIGPDLPKKDAKIAELKAKIFSDPAAMSFDYEVLYAHKLDPDTLKKSLLSLPYMAAKRLVVLRQCERLTRKKEEEQEPAKEDAAPSAATNVKDRSREIIFEFLENAPPSTVLVLDFEKFDLKSQLFARLRPLTEVVFFGSDKTIDVWALTRAIGSRNSGDALRILHELLDNNDHPLKIMGGLVWYWGKERDRLSPQRFVQGLSILEEGDLNIKRSRLKPEYAVEKVVVELASL
jgi:DNA polymerase III delta subunit